MVVWYLVNLVHKKLPCVSERTSLGLCLHHALQASSDTRLSCRPPKAGGAGAHPSSLSSVLATPSLEHGDSLQLHVTRLSCVVRLALATCLLSACRVQLQWPSIAVVKSVRITTVTRSHACSPSCPRIAHMGLAGLCTPWPSAHDDSLALPHAFQTTAWTLVQSICHSTHCCLLEREGTVCRGCKLRCTCRWAAAMVATC